MSTICKKTNAEMCGQIILYDMQYTVAIVHTVRKAINILYKKALFNW